MEITKAHAKRMLGIETDSSLAAYFGISKQTVSKWGDDDATLPPARAWELRARHPKLFGLPGKRDAA